MIAIPLALTFFRLLLGPLIIFWAASHFPRLAFAPFLLAGTLSDIFDGIIARRLNVARPWLRRFDSITDVFYYLSVIIATYLVAARVLQRSILPIALIIISELAPIVISYGRFRTYPSTHCYSAKAYGIALFFAFVAILSFGSGPWVLYGLSAFALLANSEVVAILLLSSSSPVDVRSIFDLKSRSSLR